VAWPFLVAETPQRCRSGTLLADCKSLPPDFLPRLPFQAMVPVNRRASLLAIFAAHIRSSHLRPVVRLRSTSLGFSNMRIRLLQTFAFVGMVYLFGSVVPSLTGYLG